MAAEIAESCPDQHRLEQIAARVAATESDLLHVENCADCRSALARIRAERAFFEEVEGAIHEPAPQARDNRATFEIPGYALQTELRRGGQGVVYSALQRSTGRSVAIKVMRQGPFSTRADRARFEREVQVLAKLNHPNIVTIYDSGICGGCHYFVMNLLPGEPLDVFIERQDSARSMLSSGRPGSKRAKQASLPRSELTRRLLLFEKVCDAVNAAHLRGVIHRDLKPANILVDDHGEPHVLDFGLARESTGAVSELTVTQTGHFIGTPLWASPEQFSETDAQIDVRSDVYSLGVILYQLLVGRWPYGEARSLPEIVAAVRDSEPILPGKLCPSLVGDLDTIVLKCLEKDPRRRYETAGALARDIHHYLRGEPIDARRSSAWYVLSKSIRRHRRFVAGFMLIVLALLGGGSVAIYNALESSKARTREQYERARVASEQAKADAITQITREVFPQGDRTTLVTSPQFQALQRIARGIDDGNLEGRPLVEIAVRSAMADIYRERGLPGFAEAELREAHQRSLLSFGEMSAATASATDALADLLLQRGAVWEAERRCRAGLEVRRRILGNEHVDVARSLDTLANILLARKEPKEALELVRESLRIRQVSLGAEHLDVALARSVLAHVLLELDRVDDAETECRMGLAIRFRLLNDRHPAISQSLDLLTRILDEKAGASTHTADLRRLADELRSSDLESMSLNGWSNLLNLKKQILGENHIDIAESHLLISSWYSHRKDFVQAAEEARTALPVFEANYGPDSLRVADCLLVMAEAYRQARLDSHVLGLLERRYRIYEHHLRNSNLLSVGVYQRELGDAYCRAGRHADGEREIRAALAYLQDALGPEHREVAWCMGWLAATLAGHGKVAEADPLSREALDMNLRIDPKARFTEMLRHTRGIVLAACGDFDAASDYLTSDDVYSDLANWVRSYHQDFREVLESGATYFRSKGQSAMADRWQATADAVCD